MWPIQPYENALAGEFCLLGIPYLQQKKFRSLFKTKKDGEYIPDLNVFDKIIIDTKVIERKPDLEIR